MSEIPWKGIFPFEPLPDDGAIRCPGCHAQDQFTGDQLLQLRADGVTWLTCDLCGERFTPAEWAVYNSTFPQERVE